MARSYLISSGTLQAVDTDALIGQIEAARKRLAELARDGPFKTPLPFDGLPVRAEPLLTDDLKAVMFEGTILVTPAMMDRIRVAKPGELEQILRDVTITVISWRPTTLSDLGCLPTTTAPRSRTSWDAPGGPSGT